MNGARPRCCGHLVVAALVAFALAMSLPFCGPTAALASRTRMAEAAAYEGPTDGVDQTARKTEAIHRQARPAKPCSSLDVDIASLAASVRVTPDLHISWIQPSGTPAVRHSWTMNTALGRAPPA
jgi:hypothetical protein